MKKDELDSVEQWACAPAEALQGGCKDSRCPNPNCLDPRVTVHEIYAEDKYRGPLVIVTYATKEASHCLRVNGDDLTHTDVGAPRELADEWMHRSCRTVRERYGRPGVMALYEHLHRRLRAPVVRRDEDLN